MYLVKESSERAKKIFAPIVKNETPLPSKIGKEFPFIEMEVGQSFYMQFRENTPYQISLAKQRVNRYNKIYAVYFVILKHEDEPKRLEVARIA